jgi:hypothetical protein
VKGKNDSSSVTVEDKHDRFITNLQRLAGLTYISIGSVSAARKRDQIRQLVT